MTLFEEIYGLGAVLRSAWTLQDVLMRPVSALARRRGHWRCARLPFVLALRPRARFVGLPAEAAPSTANDATTMAPRNFCHWGVSLVGITLRELQAGSPLKGRMVRFVETKLTAARQTDHGQ